MEIIAQKIGKLRGNQAWHYLENQRVDSPKTQYRTKHKCQKKSKVNEIVTNDIWLYSQIGAHPICHQRGIIRQLVGRGAQTHS